MCVNDEDGNPICDANGVPFGGFKPSTKLLEVKKLVEAIPRGESTCAYALPRNPAQALSPRKPTGHTAGCLPLAP